MNENPARMQQDLRGRIGSLLYFCKGLRARSCRFRVFRIRNIAQFIMRDESAVRRCSSARARRACRGQSDSLLGAHCRELRTRSCLFPDLPNPTHPIFHRYQRQCNPTVLLRSLQQVRFPFQYQQLFWRSSRLEELFNGMHSMCFPGIAI